MAKISSIVKDMKTCMVCGSPHPEKHHIFYGTANRAVAEKYGYFIPLCSLHHRGAQSPHFNKKIDLAYKCMAQERFEAKGTRAEFRKLFGKSYL